MVTCRALFLALCVAGLAACSGETEPSDADSGASPPDAAVDAGLARCCPLDPTPDGTCGCVRIGGPTPPDGVCPERCSVNQADLQIQGLGAECLYYDIPANSVCEVPDGG